MRDKNRIKPFLDELGKIWEEKCPDWRFGQLMYNLMCQTGDFFYFEEDRMLKEIKKYFHIEEKDNEG